MNAELVRFANVMIDMQELLEEAYDIVKSQGSDTDANRAYSYWYAHIMGAIDKDSSDFLGGSMIDMAETYVDLKNVEEA